MQSSALLYYEKASLIELAASISWTASAPAGRGYRQTCFPDPSAAMANGECSSKWLHNRQGLAR